MSDDKTATDRKRANQKARKFFDGIWQSGDYWNLETSDFERAKYEHEIAMLDGYCYKRALDIGCGAGQFTRMLAPFVKSITAVDVAPLAIARARARGQGHREIEFRVENIMDHDFRTEPAWDLIVMNETIYYLGWLYSFFDIAWMANELYGATEPGGTFLMANTRGDISDYLLRPWIIHTYRDLFVNVGYIVKAEDVFQGKKNNVIFETLITVFVKRPNSV
jgi:2-polyprenyl-3-methyl-5-hydroxy-6-metoxy-1,4-benzoquinol methylase